MKTPQEFWNKKYAEGGGFDELVTENPSNAVEKLVDYLRTRRIPLSGNLIDIGCGMGRNSNWLTQLGFNVTGVDVSGLAVEEAKKRAERLGLSVAYQAADITDKIPVADASMDFALDIVVSQVLSSDQQKRYKREVSRVLKPGGRFLLYTLDRSTDREAQNLVKNFPGAEENTYVIPEFGLQEKTFTLDEIKALWMPFELEHSELIFFPSKFKGKTFERYFWWVMLRKSLMDEKSS